MSHAKQVLLTLLFFAFPDITAAQEFDWSDDFTGGRKTTSQSSGTFADNGLPGVRRNPTADQGSNCVQASLGEVITGSQRDLDECVGRPLTILSIPTDRLTDGFINSPR